jgi:hypothetical protein
MEGTGKMGRRRTREIPSALWICFARYSIAREGSESWLCRQYPGERFQFCPTWSPDEYDFAVHHEGRHGANAVGCSQLATRTVHSFSLAMDDDCQIRERAIQQVKC